MAPFFELNASCPSREAASVSHFTAASRFRGAAGQPEGVGDEHECACCPRKRHPSEFLIGHGRVPAQRRVIRVDGCASQERSGKAY
jgi:hypothetical protein